VKLLYWVLRILHWRKNGGVVNKFASMSTGTRINSFKHLFAGVFANLEERRFYRANPHLHLAPTMFTFFGLVNVQARGKEIGPDELHLCPFREIAHLEYDLQRYEHFGRVRGRILLLDYGMEGLNEIILREFSKSKVA
jgi:hypothetical protein